MIGGGGKQAQKQALAHAAPFGIELLDADVIHVHRAVHRGAMARLGDDDRRLAHQRAQMRLRGCRQSLRGVLIRILGHHAQCRAGQHPQLLVTPVNRGEVAVLIAKEGEVIVADPFQELDRFVDILLVGDRFGDVAQLLDRDIHLGEDRLPVLDRLAHVGKDRLQDRHDFRAVLFRRLAADLDQHVGLGRNIHVALILGQADAAPIRIALHPDDRVKQRVNGQVLAIECGNHRVDQKRHVIVDDLDHGVPRLPTVFIQRRIVDPDLGLAGGTLAREIHVRNRRAIQGLYRHAGEVVARCGSIVTSKETLGGFHPFRRQFLPSMIDHACDRLAL